MKTIEPNRQLTSFNIWIVILKIFFSIVIFLFHSEKFNENISVFCVNGYLAVEFFFIVNGYFLCQSVMNKNLDTVAFIKRKFISIADIYYSAFFVSFITRQIIFKSGPAHFFKNLFASVFEIIPVFMIGIKPKYIYNGPIWYISSMFIAMLIIYPIVKRFGKRFTTLFSLLFALVCYAIIYQNTSNGTVEVTASWWFITYLGNIRALGGICLGIFIYELAQILKNMKSVVLSVLKAVSAILSFAFLLIYIHFNYLFNLDVSYDYLAITAIGILVLIAFTINYQCPKIILSIFQVASKICVLLFFSHRCIVFQLIDSQKDQTFTVKMFYYLIGTVVSIITVFCLSNIIKRIRMNLLPKVFCKNANM